MYILKVHGFRIKFKNPMRWQIGLVLQNAPFNSALFDFNIFGQITILNKPVIKEYEKELEMFYLVKCNNRWKKYTIERKEYHIIEKNLKNLYLGNKI